MKFLAVLVFVFFQRTWIGGNPLRDLLPFGAWAGFVRKQVTAQKVRYFVYLGVPVVLTLLVSIEIRDWILGLVWLLLSLAILLYAIDIEDMEARFDDEAEWLRSEGHDTSMAAMIERQEEFRMVALYDVFQNLYPALFWFLLLGPAGALAYVLSREYLDGLDDNDPELDLVEQVVYWLEWPAVRLTGLVFALVGRFGRCFDEWLATLGDTREPSANVLLRFADAAGDDIPHDGQDIESFASASALANEELRVLLDRTLFGWLGLAAIVVIMGL